MVSQALNTFVQEAVEAGVPAAVTLMLIISAPVLLGVRYLQRADSDTAKLGLVSVSSGLVAVEVYNLLWSSMFSDMSCCASLFFLIAHAANIIEDGKGTGSPSCRSSAGACLFLVCIEAIPMAHLVDSRRNLQETIEHIASCDQTVTERLTLANRETSGDSYLNLVAGVHLFQCSGAASFSARTLITSAKGSAALYPPSTELAPSLVAFEQSYAFNRLEDASAHNLAWLYVMQGDVQRGSAMLAQAIRLAPSDPVYHASAAILSTYSGHSDQAERELAIAISWAPGILTSAFAKDLARLRPDVLRVGTRMAEEYLRASRSDPIVRVRLTHLLLLQGRISEAFRYAETGITELPNVAGAWQNKAALDKSFGRYTAALEEYKKAVYLAPSVELIDSLQEIAKVIDPSSAAVLQRARASFAAHRSSPHAKRAAILYARKGVLKNDLLPSDLLEYISAD